MKLAVILSVLLVGLVGLVLWEQRPQPAATLQGDLLFNLTPDAVARIKITVGTAPAIVLEQSADHHWNLVAPEQHPADDRIVSNILATVLRYRLQKRIDPPSSPGVARSVGHLLGGTMVLDSLLRDVLWWRFPAAYASLRLGMTQNVHVALPNGLTKSAELSDYGLQQPRIVLELTDTSAQVYTVHLGDLAPTGYGLYLRRSPGDEIFLGGGHLFVALNRTPTEFRKQ